MSIQYPRKMSLVVADSIGRGLEFEQFAVRFAVRRGDVQTPNSCDVRIYNLNDETAHQITSSDFSTRSVQLALSAGYQENFGLIFRGTIKQVRVGRESAKDSYVDITAADGDEAYNFAAMSLSLAAGSKPQDHIQAALQTMAKAGISQGYLPKDLSVNGLVRGRVFYGMTRDELRDIAIANNCHWSIQDGALTLIPKTSYIPAEAVVISPETGLLGVPEQTQNGIEMDVLLNPNIKIGQLIKLEGTVNRLRLGLDLESQRDKTLLLQTVKTNGAGLYYVMQRDDYGDTRGEDWHSHLTCLAVDATIPPSQVESQVVAPPDVAQGPIRQY